MPEINHYAYLIVQVQSDTLQKETKLVGLEDKRDSIKTQNNQLPSVLNGCLHENLTVIKGLKT